MQPRYKNNFKENVLKIVFSKYSNASKSHPSFTFAL